MDYEKATLKQLQRELKRFSRLHDWAGKQRKIVADLIRQREAGAQAALVKERLPDEVRDALKAVL